MKHYLSVLPVLAIGLAISTGCAHSRSKAKAYAKQCNENSAYEKGVNEALNGVRMSSEWVSHCEVEIREAIKSKYQDGFMTALKNAPQNVKK